MRWIPIIVVFIVCFGFVFPFFTKKQLLNPDSYSKSIYEYNLIDIDGNQVSMEQFKDKKIIIVNVASKCSYTPQYEQLEALNQIFDTNLVILGFPSNDFFLARTWDKRRNKIILSKELWCKISDVSENSS